MELNKKFSDGTLHRIHLWADFSIGVIALVGLLFAEVLETWYTIDLVFHITIFIMATGGIVTEKLLHRHKHGTELFGKGLHRIHLVADLSISAMAVIGLLFAEVLEAFFQVDFVFHIAIFVLAIGGIIAEKVLHRHKHSGVIGS